MIACALSSVFSLISTSGTISALDMSGTLSNVLIVIFGGVISGAILRLVVRIVYGIGDRVFFRIMRSAPDYNLRRLPISYNAYLRYVMLGLVVAKLFAAIFCSLLTFVYPVAYYLWVFLSDFCTLACLVVTYVMLDKHYVPDWQSKQCFVSLAMPTLILFVLDVLVF
jgi:hypothetical protein